MLFSRKPRRTYIMEKIVAITVMALTFAVMAYLINLHINTPPQKCCDCCDCCGCRTSLGDWDER